MRKTALVLFLLFVARGADAASFNEWLHKRVMAQVAKRDPATQQIDPPAALLPEANVADLAAAADVASLALSFAGVGDQPKDAQSVSASAYALIVGGQGGDADDVATMRAHPLARRIFVTVATKDATDTDPAARLFQTKWLAFDGRDLTTAQNATIMRDLVAVATSDVDERVEHIVLTSPAVLSNHILPRYREELLQNATALGLVPDAIHRRVERLAGRITPGKRLKPEPGDSTPLTNLDLRFWTHIQDALVGANFDAVAALLTRSERNAIDAVIAANLDPFAQLASNARQIVSRVRRASQFAIAANLLDPQSDDARKTFGVEAIYTIGLSRLWNLTANAHYKRPEAVHNDDELTVAALFRRQMQPKVGGRAAMYLDLGGNASLLNDERTYRAQAKATITILQGLQVPISVTWANRDELVEESNVTGHIGISFDFSRAGGFFRRSAPEDEE